MKAKKFLLPLIAFIVILAVMAVAFFTIGEDGAFATPWALLAPVIAIALALITKEVYSSLFIGVVIGAILNANFSFTGTVDAAVSGGLISAVADSSGIFIFLVLLGVIVALINKSGGSQAFGRWAQTHIKTKAGAVIATFILGVFIFIDDYFNCLTVGSVMAPVTDSHKISRAKLAFIIDATAAPICMIAPISSWAAAVSGCVESETYSGIELFVRAIPFNFYSLLTLGFIILIAILGFDYGKMAGCEIKAQQGELGIIKNAANDDIPSEASHKGKVIDLLLPIVVLIVACVVGLIYVGYQSEGITNVIDAFGNTDAYVGLPWGCIIALIIIVVYLMARRIITFKEAMECVPKGFIAMVPAILILTLATALKNMTGGLGADVYVEGLMKNAAPGLQSFLPAIIFVVACFLAFATGTSWGTFGILIPIVTSMFTETDPIFFIAVSACLAGAVCGDHCSPISDTTIMASAGAQCKHIEHVSTQLPYAITIAAVSFVSFIIAGFVKNVYISLAAAFALLIITVLVIKMLTKKKEA